MRGGGDQADVAMRLAARGVIAADRQQPGIFALRAGIRLQRDRVIAGDVAQPLLEPREQRVIARGLLARRERMQVAEFRPGQRDHLGGGVELHGAGAERDHGAVEREVAVARAAHVAQHLGLGAVRVEHRMGEEGAGALQLCRQRLARAGFDVRVGKLAAEGAPDRLDRRPPWWSRRARCRACASPIRRLIFSASARATISARAWRRHRPSACRRKLPTPAQSRACASRPPALRRGDARGAAMCGQALPGRDRPRTSRRSPPAAPARCRCWRSPSRGGCAARGSAARADRPGSPRESTESADEAAGQRALERVAHRHVGRMRAAIAHRHAKALRRADRDVGAEFAGRGEQRQRQQIGGDDRERALGVQRRDRRPQVAHRAGRARILQQRAEHLGACEIGQRDRRR